MNIAIPVTEDMITRAVHAFVERARELSGEPIDVAEFPEKEMGELREAFRAALEAALA